MGRRQLAGKDMKIAQGHRRDAFFAKMKRKGGVPRLPSDGVIVAAEAIEDEAVETEAIETEATDELPVAAQA
jgi:hypothetical protein